MEKLKDSFVELTDKALPETDVNKFMEYLTERERYRELLMDSLLGFTKEEAQRLLAKETKVFERLQQERIKLLGEMEAVSVEKKASNAYAARPRLPQAPAFFSKRT
jgi:hypothetical protein